MNELRFTLKESARNLSLLKKYQLEEDKIDNEYLNKLKDLKEGGADEETIVRNIIDNNNFKL